jgi:sialic acid synthase
MKAGEEIQETDLHMLSPGDGFKCLDTDLVIGKKLALDMPADEIIYPNMLES